MSNTHLMCTVGGSDVKTCAKIKRAKLIHHPPLPASLFSVFQCLYTVSTAVQKSAINTHQMHGGTGQNSAAELCVPAT